MFIYKKYSIQKLLSKINNCGFRQALSKPNKKKEKAKKSFSTSSFVMKSNLFLRISSIMNDRENQIPCMVTTLDNIYCVYSEQ